MAALIFLYCYISIHIFILDGTGTRKYYTEGTAQGHIPQHRGPFVVISQAHFDTVDFSLQVQSTLDVPVLLYVTLSTKSKLGPGPNKPAP